MAATQSSTPLKQEADIDMNSFIDFSGGDSYSSPKQDSYFPRPALETSELPDSEDFQTFSGPSHEYERYQQQTGLPPAALTHLHAFIDEESQTLSHSSTSASGNLDIPTASFNEDTSFDSLMGDTMDGFPYDEQNTQPTQSQINHDAAQRLQPRRSLQEISYRPSGSNRLNVPPQSQFASVQRSQSVSTPQTLHPQQTLQASPISRPTSQQRFDSQINVDETIHRVLAQIRHDSVQSGNNSEDADSPNSNAPHFARSKKDEEEMDEDEKLLASEEGKKLSSKERRQLRNKVSARAFRHRRKEYINTLEDELKSKTNELSVVSTENQKLLKENEQMTAFIKEILSKPAFRGTLEDLASEQQLQVQNSSMPPPPRRVPSSHLLPPATPTTMPTTTMSTTAMPSFSMASSTMGYQNPQLPFSQAAQPSVQPSRSSGQDFDMAAMNGLNLQGGNDQWGSTGRQTPNAGNQWNNDTIGFDFNDFPTYAVLELPEGPSLQQLSSESLSGKGRSPVLSAIEAGENGKRDCPIISEFTTAFNDKERSPASLPTATGSSSADSDFELYCNVPVTTSQNLTLPPCSSKYELVVLPLRDASMINEERLKRMHETLEASVERLEDLM